MFAQWACSAINPLTEKPYFSCQPDQVDDVIRQDFEDKELGTAMFIDRYRDLLEKYSNHLSPLGNNTVKTYMGTIASFFSHEAIPIKLPQGTIPSTELAVGEHTLSREDIQAMHAVADWEGKARISTALLGWGVGKFLKLKVDFIKEILAEKDADGFCAFITNRGKTKRFGVKAVGVLIPEAVKDLTTYLSNIPSSQTRLWTITSRQGMNVWLKALAEKAGIHLTGQLRFHLFRKFMYTIARDAVDSEFAKLIVGKKINYSDLTYMQGLKQRILKQYKEKVYPQVQLTIVPQHHQDLQVQIDHKSQEIKDLKTSLTTLQEINVEHKQQLQDFREKMMILLSSEITLQKLDLLTLKDLTQHQPRKETAFQAYQLHLEANLKELEEIQRQLLQDPDLKTTYHRLRTQQIADEDYLKIIKDLHASLDN